MFLTVEEFGHICDGHQETSIHIPLEEKVVVGHQANCPLQNNLPVSWPSSFSSFSFCLRSLHVVAETQAQSPPEVKKVVLFYDDQDLIL